MNHKQTKDYGYIGQRKQRPAFLHQEREILLECSDIPSYAPEVQRAVNLPGYYSIYNSPAIV